MRFSTAYRNVKAKFNPQYPNAWQGELKAVFCTGKTAYRVSWDYRRNMLTNDWAKIDTAKRICIAPRFAKWFELCSYYAGHYRNMYHLTIGRLTVSRIPTTHFGNKAQSYCI